MTQPDDLLIERNTDVDLDPDELWTLISTPEGWCSWLVDHADVTVATGADGTAIDDGVERVVHIDSVTDGSAIGFSWWKRDDPAVVSYVQLDIIELPDRRSQLHITERLHGSNSATARSCSASVTWDVRLISLWLLALPCLVPHR